MAMDLQALQVLQALQAAHILALTLVDFKKIL
jgi:hypothetical protein